MVIIQSVLVPKSSNKMMFFIWCKLAQKLKSCVMLDLPIDSHSNNVVHFLSATRFEAN